LKTVDIYGRIFWVYIQRSRYIFLKYANNKNIKVSALLTLFDRKVDLSVMNEIDKDFGQVAAIIENARANAFRKVNEELILMYRNVGRLLSEKAKDASYGDGYVEALASYIQEYFPGIKGFNRRGLYRMKQFYELYEGNEKVSALLTQLSWSCHLLIMSGCKSDEEREFYIRLAIKERYTYRELERQMDSGYYERYMLSKEKLLPEKVQAEINPFLDSYVIEFLDLPTGFLEKDLRKGLIAGMKQFMLEIGKDFTFIDEEYAITVGGEDFRIDLLFYHRTLRCLVAMELKTGKFKPEYVSKMDFYLEGLDRQVKKPDENPSVGLILCASKNDEVVEYAMSRTMSPMMVSQYQLQLPDKEVLRKKLQELANIPQIEDKQI
jgi:predicted nuclease of restriction endonuclease-like (RecB) superfamily